jgi:short-subunit dehydrogenase
MSTHRPLAVVTGATSGIGFELAGQFAAHGFAVAISGSSESVHSSAERLRAEHGVEVFPFRGDAATYDGVEGFWQEVVELGRPVEAAALNVGIGLGGAFVDNELDDDLRVIAINVTGTVHMAKRVVRHMVANGRGRILVVSSLSATTPTPFETVYGPSKAFGFSFAESLRAELEGTGVTVTALLPGATDSNFHRNGGMGSSKIGAGPKQDKRLVGRQGFEGLMAGVDYVIGGDDTVVGEFENNRQTPEAEKARRMAERTRLPSSHAGAGQAREGGAQR